MGVERRHAREVPGPHRRDHGAATRPSTDHYQAVDLQNSKSFAQRGSPDAVSLEHGRLLREHVGRFESLHVANYFTGDDLGDLLCAPKRRCGLAVSAVENHRRRTAKSPYAATRWPKRALGGRSWLTNTIKLTRPSGRRSRGRRRRWPERSAARPPARPYATTRIDR